MVKLYFKLKKRFSNKGFTLVELLAVIVILAIILLIAIPTVLNSIEAAKRKSFVNFADKSVNLANQMYAKELSTEEPPSDCIIYNIKNELDLPDTGEYDGWILLNTNTDDIYITLFTKDLAVVAFHYNDPSLKLRDSIKNRGSVEVSKLTQEYLCNSSNCVTCMYSNDSGDVVIDNDDYKLLNGAMLMDGKSFNKKLHQLFGKQYDTMYIEEVTSIEKSDALNETAEKIDVSDESSNNKVYIWRDNDKVYFYSEGKGDIFLNPNCYNMFYGMPNLTYIDFGNLNTSKLVSMRYMFENTSLQNTDLNLIDTHNVTDMSGVFSRVKATNIDISGWNTSKVIKMNSMFGLCINLTDINFDNINTSNVNTMAVMFSGCMSLTKLDLAKFNTSKVTNMSGMFEGCVKLTDLNTKSFDTSQVTDMSFMFAVCESLSAIDLSHFNTSNVTNMGSMFNGAYGTSFRDYSRVYYNKFSKIIGLENWDVSKVRMMDQMFYHCSGLETIDLNHWNPVSVINVSSMFESSGLKSIEITNFNSPNLGSMRQMFMQCYSLKTVKITGMNVSNVTWMSGVFMYDSSLTEVDLSGWKTDNAEDISGMFSYCSYLRKVDLSNFNTTKATNMASFFNGCYYLEEVDISSFSFTKEVTVGSMFKNCRSLKKIYVSSKWSNTYLKDSSYSRMFDGAIYLLNYDPNDISVAKAYVGDGGYLSYK